MSSSNDGVKLPPIGQRGHGKLSAAERAEAVHRLTQTKPKEEPPSMAKNVRIPSERLDNMMARLSKHSHRIQRGSTEPRAYGPEAPTVYVGGIKECKMTEYDPKRDSNLSLFWARKQHVEAHPTAAAQPLLSKHPRRPRAPRPPATHQRSAKSTPRGGDAATADDPSAADESPARKEAGEDDTAATDADADTDEKPADHVDYTQGGSTKKKRPAPPTKEQPRGAAASRLRAIEKDREREAASEPARTKAAMKPADPPRQTRAAALRAEAAKERKEHPPTAESSPRGRSSEAERRKPVKTTQRASSKENDSSPQPKAKAAKKTEPAAKPASQPAKKQAPAPKSKPAAKPAAKPEAKKSAAAKADPAAAAEGSGPQQERSVNDDEYEMLSDAADSAGNSPTQHDGGADKSATDDANATSLRTPPKSPKSPGKASAASDSAAGTPVRSPTPAYSSDHPTPTATDSSVGSPRVADDSEHDGEAVGDAGDAEATDTNEVTRDAPAEKDGDVAKREGSDASAASSTTSPKNADDEGQADNDANDEGQADNDADDEGQADNDEGQADNDADDEGQADNDADDEGQADNDADDEGQADNDADGPEREASGEKEAVSPAQQGDETPADATAASAEQPGSTASSPTVATKDRDGDVAATARGSNSPMAPQPRAAAKDAASDRPSTVGSRASTFIDEDTRRRRKEEKRRARQRMLRMTVIKKFFGANAEDNTFQIGVGDAPERSVTHLSVGDPNLVVCPSVEPEAHFWAVVVDPVGFVQMQLAAAPHLVMTVEAGNTVGVHPDTSGRVSAEDAGSGPLPSDADAPSAAQWFEVVELANDHFALESVLHRGHLVEAALDEDVAALALIRDEDSSSFCELVVTASEAPPPDSPAASRPRTAPTEHLSSDSDDAAAEGDASANADGAPAGADPTAGDEAANAGDPEL